MTRTEDVTGCRRLPGWAPGQAPSRAGYRVRNPARGKAA